VRGEGEKKKKTREESAPRTIRLSDRRGWGVFGGRKKERRLCPGRSRERGKGGREKRKKKKEPVSAGRSPITQFEHWKGVVLLEQSKGEKKKKKRSYSLLFLYHQVVFLYRGGKEGEESLIPQNSLSVFSRVKEGERWIEEKRKGVVPRRSSSIAGRGGKGEKKRGGI